MPEFGVDFCICQRKGTQHGYSHAYCSLLRSPYFSCASLMGLAYCIGSALNPDKTCGNPWLIYSPAGANMLVNVIAYLYSLIFHLFPTPYPEELIFHYEIL